MRFFEQGPDHRAERQAKDHQLLGQIAIDIRWDYIEHRDGFRKSLSRLFTAGLITVYAERKNGRRFPVRNEHCAVSADVTEKGAQLLAALNKKP